MLEGLLLCPLHLALVRKLPDPETCVGRHNILITCPTRGECLRPNTRLKSLVEDFLTHPLGNIGTFFGISPCATFWSHAKPDTALWSEAGIYGKRGKGRFHHLTQSRAKG